MSRLKAIGMILIGWALLILGVIGLFLPFLQGVLFILVGLAILSSRSKVIRRFLEYMERRFPQYHEKIMAWRKKVKSWFHREDPGS